MASHTDFWNFSLDFYRKPNVASVCLSLQDKFAVDVNLMLFILWLALQRRIVDHSHLAMLETGVGSWRDHVVRAVRVIRRRIKSGVDGTLIAGTDRLNQLLKSAELEAERVEQLQLAWLRETQLTTLAITDSRASAALASFAAYAMTLQTTLPTEDLQILINALEEII